MTSLLVTASAEVSAPPGDVFALLADPRRHHVLDGSGSVRGCVETPAILALGAVFVMRMRMRGLSYRSRNEVVEFDPPRRIAWRTTPHSRALRMLFGGQTWRFEIVEAEQGCVVTESWDPTTIERPLATRAMRFARTNRRGMEATLERLRQQFRANQP